ncbi:hypothetical protein RyT2_05830 [Pseudolactococcus yaeyamensis]
MAHYTEIKEAYNALAEQNITDNGELMSFDFEHDMRLIVEQNEKSTGNSIIKQITNLYQLRSKKFLEKFPVPNIRVIVDGVSDVFKLKTAKARRAALYDIIAKDAAQFQLQGAYKTIVISGEQFQVIRENSDVENLAVLEFKNISVGKAKELQGFEIWKEIDKDIVSVLPLPYPVYDVYRDAFDIETKEELKTYSEAIKSLEQYVTILQGNFEERDTAFFEKATEEMTQMLENKYRIPTNEYEDKIDERFKQVLEDKGIVAYTAKKGLDHLIEKFISDAANDGFLLSAIHDQIVIEGNSVEGAEYNILRMNLEAVESFVLDDFKNNCHNLAQYGTNPFFDKGQEMGYRVDISKREAKETYDLLKFNHGTSPKYAKVDINDIIVNEKSLHEELVQAHDTIDEFVKVSNTLYANFDTPENHEFVQQRFESQYSVTEVFEGLLGDCQSREDDIKKIIDMDHFIHHNDNHQKLLEVLQSDMPLAYYHFKSFGLNEATYLPEAQFEARVNQAEKFFQQAEMGDTLSFGTSSILVKAVSENVNNGLNPVAARIFTKGEWEDDYLLFGENEKHPPRERIEEILKAWGADEFDSQQAPLLKEFYKPEFVQEKIQKLMVDVTDRFRDEDVRTLDKIVTEKSNGLAHIFYKLDNEESDKAMVELRLKSSNPKLLDPMSKDFGDILKTSRDTRKVFAGVLVNQEMSKTR